MLRKPPPVFRGKKPFAIVHFSVSSQPTWCAVSVEMVEQFLDIDVTAFACPDKGRYATVVRFVVPATGPVEVAVQLARVRKGFTRPAY